MARHSLPLELVPHRRRAPSAMSPRRSPNVTASVRLPPPRSRRGRSEQEHAVDLRHPAENLERPRGLRRFESQDDDRGGVILEAARELSGSTHRHAQSGLAPQHGLDARGDELVAGHDEDRGRRRGLAGDWWGSPPLGHVHTRDARTKRATCSIGTARAKGPAAREVRPMIRPPASASGPPELPGARCKSAWIHGRPPRSTGPIAQRIPAASAPRPPPAGPTATTNQPTRTVP